MTGRWRLLRDAAVSAARAMSVDESLLAHVCDGVPAIRLYRFERPAVSLGYRQAIPAWVERAREGGMDVVRRATGGGSVVHAGDLVYAVVAPLGWPGIPRGARGAYEWVRDAASLALAEVGLDVQPATPEAGASRASLCFSASTGSELSLAGCKLLGSAQRRTRRGWLQHGSIRLSDDSRWYVDVLGEPAPAMPSLPPALDVERVECALARAFEVQLGCASEQGELHDDEEREARLRESCRRAAPLECPPLPVSRH